jgi:hypothetical protein
VEIGNEVFKWTDVEVFVEFFSFEVLNESEMGGG